MNGKFAHQTRNLDEFVAEALSSKPFIEALGKINYESDKSIWDKFKEFLASIFGIPYNSVASHTIETILNRIETNDYYTKLIRYDGQVEAVPAPRSATRNYTANDIEAKDLERDPVTNKYKDKAGKSYNSVTGNAIPEMQSKQWAEDGLTPGQRRAKAIWGSEDKSSKRKIRDIVHMVTFDEAAAY